MISRKRWFVIGGAFLLGVLLSGCSTEPTPTPPPPAEKSIEVKAGEGRKLKMPPPPGKLPTDPNNSGGN